MALIFAPHADDELIGCWRLVSSKHDPLTVAYCEPPNAVRLKEIREAEARFGFEAVVPPEGASLWEFILHHVLAFSGIIWAPDPHWELHPLHKEVGSLARSACRRANRRFGVYSTSMNAPYLRELSTHQAGLKKEALDSIYPSQASLWATDHRYWLFEGTCEEGVIA